jgi:hypothetical protein
MLPSVISLKFSLNKYFRSRGIRDFRILSYIGFKHQHEILKDQNIVLIGDGPFYFANLVLAKTLHRAHVWVLCSAMHRLVVQGMGLSPSQVTLINRYDLFPAAGPAYKLSESRSWVYAGRDFPGKNVELLLRFTSVLQTQFQDERQLADFLGRAHRNFSEI